MRDIVVDGDNLTLDQVVAVARADNKVAISVAISDEACRRMEKSRDIIDAALNKGRIVYGVNTGFGRLCDVVIEPDDEEALQRKVILSCCSGVGRPLDIDVVRAMMLLRINALCKGSSGIRPSVTRLLMEMLNHGVHPVVPEKGSLGASGDLAPLAHLCSVMIGEGEAYYNGRRLGGAEAMSSAGLTPVVLKAKEGLSLINGTQAMTAIACLAIHDTEILMKTADIAAALSMDALRGIPSAFRDHITGVRPHPGAVASASNLRRLLDGSKLTTRPGELRIQDAYALRCAPQVHGASRDAMAHVRRVIEIEMNSSTDNPLVFPDLPEGEEILSGGNFHGQPVALAADYMGIAVSELADISERRIERLVNPALSGLPAFLVWKAGLNSGFMMVQYTAAALVSENKVLAHPASVDSIPSSANQEDHVSMGTIAARKAREIVWNASQVLAMEILTAAQAVEFSSPEDLGRGTRAAYDLIRRHVNRMEEDRPPSPDIEIVEHLVRSGQLLQTVEAAVGSLE